MSDPFAEPVPPEADEVDEHAAGPSAYDEMIALHEEQLAAARVSAIAAGRRRAGVAGAAMAGAMMAVAEIYEGPPKEDAPVTVEASSDPTDIDRDGVDLTVGEVDVSSPPLARLDPVVGDQRKRPQL
jgi:hypothetical protein